MEHPTRIGKYNIDQYLGGGMSHVYRATDSVLGRRVAVKVLELQEINFPAEGNNPQLLQSRWPMPATPCPGWQS